MNIGQAAHEFYRQFHYAHAILYVGQGLSKSELEELAFLPWSAVVTSWRDEDFPVLFASDDRSVCPLNPQTYAADKKHTGITLSRTRLPILQLFGAPANPQDADEDTSSDEEESALDCARAMFPLLPDLIHCANALVVVGIDSELDWKLWTDAHNRALFWSTPEGSVSFWGVAPEAQKDHFDLFHDFAQRKASVYEWSLHEVIQWREGEMSQDDFRMDLPSTCAEYDIYYQAGKPVRISQSDLHLFDPVGTLLTERTLHPIHPLGRNLQQRWFSNFLESSTLGPQWYGYREQPAFAVKRSFEDALYLLVRQQLSGHSITGQVEPPCPILLSGPPCSSKSVTLASLACRIFDGHSNPVLFISKEHFQPYGKDADDLDKALQFLDGKADADTRILVIWDCSTYRPETDRAKRLLEFLESRGRRLVLVCSSSELGSGVHTGDTYLSYNREKDALEPARNGLACQVLCRKEHTIVFASSVLDEREQAAFWEICRSYSGLADDVIGRLRARLEKDGKHEVFDYYYMLITLLRSALEGTLPSGQTNVYRHVKSELNLVLKGIQADIEEEKELNPIYRAFAEAGIDISQFDSAGSKEDEETVEQNLRDLDTCVALFSRFKLDVPYRLAYMILAGENPGHACSSAAKDLFHAAITDIPWLWYGENSDGDFVFRFRNPLEAERFLDNHGVTGEQQVDFVCRIMDLYGSMFQSGRAADPTFPDHLQALLQMIGPNSNYPPFQSARKQEHNSILRKFHILMGKAQDLTGRDSDPVPDDAILSPARSA